MELTGGDLARLAANTIVGVSSPFRSCGRDLAEFFNSTGWAFYGHVKESIRNHWPTYRH